MRKLIKIVDVPNLKGKFLIDESSEDKNVVFIAQVVNDSWVQAVSTAFLPTSRGIIDGYKLVEDFKLLDDQDGLNLFKEKNRDLDLTALMIEYEEANKAVEFMETYGKIVKIKN